MAYYSVSHSTNWPLNLILILMRVKQWTWIQKTKGRKTSIVWWQEKTEKHEKWEQEWRHKGRTSSHDKHSCRRGGGMSISQSMRQQQHLCMRRRLSFKDKVMVGYTWTWLPISGHLDSLEKEESKEPWVLFNGHLWDFMVLLTRPATKNTNNPI